MLIRFNLELGLEEEDEVEEDEEPMLFALVLSWFADLDLM